MTVTGMGKKTHHHSLLPCRPRKNASRGHFHSLR